MKLEFPELKHKLNYEFLKDYQNVVNIKDFGFNYKIFLDLLLKKYRLLLINKLNFIKFYAKYSFKYLKKTKQK